MKPQLVRPRMESRLFLLVTIASCHIYDRVSSSRATLTFKRVMVNEAGKFARETGTVGSLAFENTSSPHNCTRDGESVSRQEKLIIPIFIHPHPSLKVQLNDLEICPMGNADGALGT